MEVKLDKRYELAVSAEQAWQVLCDIHVVARCMPGAQITEQLDATHYKGLVKSKVGPAVMQFAGDIEVLGLDAAAKSMQMLGKGADKSGSSASMAWKRARWRALRCWLARPRSSSAASWRSSAAACWCRCPTPC